MLARIRATYHSPDRSNRLRDFLYAKILFSLPKVIRQRLFMGDNHYCPICMSRLTKFLVIHRAYHLFCPVCLSLQRHRLVWLLFKHDGWLDHTQGNRQKILHFAPEPCLEEKFRQIPGIEYLSADLNDHRAMIKADIVALQFESESFDLIFCSHVLEHIPDDHKAISELSRILKPSGQTVLLVPIQGDKTDEDLSITDPIERERRFGQLDHVRSYGMDFIQRLEKVGFSVRLQNTTSMQMSAYNVDRMGLNEADIVFICRK